MGGRGGATRRHSCRSYRRSSPAAFAFACVLALFRCSPAVRASSCSISPAVACFFSCIHSAFTMHIRSLLQSRDASSSFECACGRWQKRGQKASRWGEIQNLSDEMRRTRNGEAKERERDREECAARREEGSNKYSRSARGEDAAHGRGGAQPKHRERRSESEGGRRVHGGSL